MTTTLHTSQIIPAIRPNATAIAARSKPVIPISEGEIPMPSEINGRGAMSATTEPTSADAIDFMSEAEALRDALGEAYRHAGRLANSLQFPQTVAQATPRSAKRLVKPEEPTSRFLGGTMSTSISIRLVRLAEQLGDLRMRLQEAARFEVAQAIADAISEATRAFICGPAQKRSASHDEQSSWDDPWRGPFDDEPSWTAKGGPPTVPRQPTENLASYHTALMTGLAVARWSFARTGQPAAALGLAAAAAIAVLLAGERIASLLDVCSVTQELLTYPNRRL